MSSFKPYYACSEMDCAQERHGAFVVSRGNRPVMFQFFKEVLNQMPGLVEGTVIESLVITV